MIENIFNKQKDFFNLRSTLDLNLRIKTLKTLKKAILDMEDEIVNALYLDLGKSSTESYMSEIGIALNEISYMLKNIKKFSKNKRVRTPLSQYFSKSYIVKSPYGVNLIISPWNYPFMLSLVPFIDSISAGNVCMIKPSEYSVNTSEVIKKMFDKYIDEEIGSVILGDVEVSKELLSFDFDYVFFTGSSSVGRLIASNLAKKAIPYTLELGGKSPCIIDKKANLSLACKRIVFGKLLNVGQTCVAPDYFLVDENIKDEFITKLKNEIEMQYTKDALNSDSYGKVINKRNFDRLVNLINLEKENLVYGGNYDLETLKIEPSVFDNITPDSPLMKEELFAPIMPVLSYKDKSEIINIINEHKNPLALYVFSEDKEFCNFFINNVNFGGGCINDTLIHIANNYMGFGGVGNSGVGRYLGKAGFDNFCNHKNIIDKKTYFDINIRYQPYNKKKKNLIKLFLK